MKIGVLGTGEVGKALGNGFVTLGHDVMMGSRSATNEKALTWAQDIGPKASIGTFNDAISFGDIVVFATLGMANESVVKSAGKEGFRGKIVVDSTNPLDSSGGMPPKLAVTGNDSGGERLQRLLSDAHVVKAFNTVGSSHMFRPSFPGGPPDMFICGNDEEAKEKVRAILSDFGWGVVDLGGIEGSRYLEAMCIAWVLYGARTRTWNHAFKLLRK
jgi:predicted dinucleotide-binding enzyme